MAVEMGIVAIPMLDLLATRAALDLHNMALTTAQARPLPALAAAQDHPRIPAPVRLLDQVRPAPRPPVPLLPVQPLRRTQATAHHPDQATVRRLHLRPRHLLGHRIRAAVVVRQTKWRTL